MSTTQRVVIHVGTPKSGTTYLQNLMWHSRHSLREAGLLYPGPEALDHFRAAVDLHNDGYLEGADPAVTGAWLRLVDEARTHHGTTVISQELLGDRSPADVARVMADLDFAEVHVVATCRDLARQLPAAWQEDLKNRHSVPFPEWLEAIHAGPGRGDRLADVFWLRQDLPAVLGRWGADLPPERVHVVTVPPRGAAPPDTLWQRFASVLEVDPAAGTPAGPPNKSLGWLEADLLRRLNERADFAVPWSAYLPRVTGYLAGEVLPERPGAVPLSLPASAMHWVQASAEEQVAALARAGYHVVGGYEELRVDPAAGHAAAPTFTEGELLDAALDAIIALLQYPPG